MPSALDGAHLPFSTGTLASGAELIESALVGHIQSFTDKVVSPQWSDDELPPDAAASASPARSRHQGWQEWALPSGRDTSRGDLSRPAGQEPSLRMLSE